MLEKRIVQRTTYWQIVIALLLCADSSISAQDCEQGLRYLRDTDSKVTIEQLAADTHLRDNFTVPQNTVLLDSAASHWFECSPNYTEVNGQNNWYLEIGFANIDQVSVHTIYPSGAIETSSVGDEVAHIQWPFPARLPTIPLSTNSENATRIYMELAATGQPAVLPITILNGEQRRDQERLDYLWYGIFFGAALSLIIYNLCIYLFTGITSYWMYVLYLTPFTALQACISGIGQQFIWPTTSEFTTVFALWLIALTNASMVLFVSSFLELRQHSPRLHMLLQVVSITSVIPPLFLGVVDYIYVQNIEHIYAFISMAVIFTIAWHRLIHGSRPARYLLVSYTVLFLGITMALLRTNGLIASSFLSEHLMEVAIVLEALVLSLGLADQINELKNKNQQIEITARLTQEQFTRNLISVHESEKRHFGAILHDDVGHQLLNMQKQIRDLKKLISSDNKKLFSIVNNLHNSSDQMMQELRQLSQDSHPHLLQELGLEDAISSLMFNTFSDMSINHSCRAVANRASRSVQQHLYRIAQECITNTSKHSNASEVLINISDVGANKISLHYKDDGNGMDMNEIENSSGFGMVSIRERVKLMGGVLSLESTPGAGMRLLVSGVPVDAN